MKGPSEDTTANLPASRPSAPAWLCVLAVTVIALPCVAVSQFIVHLDDAVLDDHLFAYYGWCINQGAVLYRDIWDHKPPGTIWLNALGYFVAGGSYSGVIAVCLLAQVGALVAFALAAMKLYQRSTAAILTVLAAVYLTHSQFFGGSNRGESYIVACDLLMLVCYLIGLERHRWGWWLAVGAVGGLSILMKQSGFAAPMAFTLHIIILFLAGRIDRRAAVQRIMMLALGAIAVLLPVMIVLALQNTLGEAWRAVVTFNCTFVAIETTGPVNTAWWWTRLDRSGLPLLKLPLLLASASLLHAVATFVHRDKLRLSNKPTSSTKEVAFLMSLLALWLLAAIAAAFAGPTPSTHYMLPVLPPLLLMGGRILDALLGEAALLERIARRASVIVALFIIAYLATDALLAQAQKAGMVHWVRNPARQGATWHVEPTAAELIGKKINELTMPDETILCWDYLPSVLLQARREHASRFPSFWLFSIARQANICVQDEYVEAITVRTPTVIVMTTQSRRQLEDYANDPFAEAHAEARAIVTRYERRAELTRGDIELWILSKKTGEVNR